MKHLLLSIGITITALLAFDVSAVEQPDSVAVVKAIGEEVRATGSAISGTAKDLTDLSTDKLSQFFDIAQEVITKHGDSAVDLGLKVLRIDAASQIIVPVIGIIISLILIYLSMRRLPYLQRPPSDADVAIMVEELKLELTGCVLTSFHNRSARQDELIQKCLRVQSNSVDETYPRENIPDSVYLNYIDRYPDEYNLTNYDIAYIVFLGVSTLVLLISVIKAVNIWAWVGIFSPEVYAVYKYIL